MAIRNSTTAYGLHEREFTKSQSYLVINWDRKIRGSKEKDITRKNFHANGINPNTIVTL